MPKRSFPLSKVHHPLEPGPVVLVTTAGKARPGIMTTSWHTMLEFKPPLVGCMISNRHYSFDLLNTGREHVINIPAVKPARQVVGCRNCSGNKTGKFKNFGFTPAASSYAGAPLIDDCYANLECIFADAMMVNKYNFLSLKL